MDTKRMNVKDIKEELRKRGAPLGGRKADLIERLTAYTKNNNFLVPVCLDPVLPNFDVPSDDQFKDINANSELPKITRPHIELFTSRFEKKDEMAEAMYNNKFLQFVRFCKSGDTTYFKGVVHAQMFKNVCYNVHMKISCDALIEGSHCDCAAGEGGSAHCKHVIIVLLGIEQMCREGIILFREACTEILQTFHRPHKKYQGTPLKAHTLTKKRALRIHFDPSPLKYRDLNTNERLFNVCAPIESTMPFKQLLVPANPYGIEWDHNYSNKANPKDMLLKSMGLLDITDDDITKIEVETRSQSKSSKWFQLRKVRMTSSHFKEICHVQSSDAAEALALRLLEPKKTKSNSMDHGIINEPKAIKEFISVTETTLPVTESGLVVSKERPYIGASPDRLLGDFFLIEVKCPYVSRHRPINPSTVPYVYVEKGQLLLKQDHEYWYQIQGQLYVTFKNMCYLVVYTYCDIKIVPIEKDSPFTNAMLNKIDAFYTQFFLPALLNKYYYRYYSEYF